LTADQRRAQLGEPERAQRLGFHVVAGGRGHIDIVGRGEPWASRLASSGVEQPVVGDGEHPRAEVGRVTLETLQVTDDLEQHLSRHVLGVGQPLRAEVADDERCHVVVQRRPRLATADDVDVAATSRDDVEAETLSSLGLAELRPALGALTADQRSVLLLRALDDRSIAEVAALLGKRPSAIKMLQHRAADALRRTLGAGATAADRLPGPPAVSGSAGPR
jgi:hypothetical protein